MSLATWQIRGIIRISQELNNRAEPAEPGGKGDSEVIVRFRKTSSGSIYMQIIDYGQEEALKLAPSDHPATMEVETAWAP